MFFVKSFLLLQLSLYTAIALAGTDPVMVEEKMEGVPFGKLTDYLLDKNGNLTIDMVSSKDVSGFKRYTKDFVALEFGDLTYWLRFSLHNPSAEPKTLYIECRYPSIDHLTLFMPETDGRFRETTIGDRQPFKDREIYHRNLVFRVELPPGESTVYLRSKHVGNTRLLMALWTPAEFKEYRVLETIFLAVQFGAMFTMLIYNFFIFLSTRSRAYLYYL
ncbi:MAG: hypothetical protein HQK54_10435, partial [Oligoflexales bacterium]|nr:hypothetical protein [Oligoflexales bacterium]